MLVVDVFRICQFQTCSAHQFNIFLQMLVSWKKQTNLKLFVHGWLRRRRQEYATMFPDLKRSASFCRTSYDFLFCLSKTLSCSLSDWPLSCTLLIRYSPNQSLHLPARLLEQFLLERTDQQTTKLQSSINRQFPHCFFELAHQLHSNSAINCKNAQRTSWIPDYSELEHRNVHAKLSTMQSHLACKWNVATHKLTKITKRSHIGMGHQHSKAPMANNTETKAGLSPEPAQVLGQLALSAPWLVLQANRGKHQDRV